MIKKKIVTWFILYVIFLQCDTSITIRKIRWKLAIAKRFNIHSRIRVGIRLYNSHAALDLAMCCHLRCTREAWVEIDRRVYACNEILMGLYGCATQPIDISWSARPLDRKFAHRHLREMRSSAMPDARSRRAWFYLLFPLPCSCRSITSRWKDVKMS